MTVSFTADSKGYEKMKAPLKQLKEMLPETGGERYSFTAAKENRNEGFMTSSQVNYVARCGTFAGSGYRYTGALKTLKVILGYDYLWLNVRVKGGAYGRDERSGQAQERDISFPTGIQTSERRTESTRELSNIWRNLTPMREI